MKNKNIICKLTLVLFCLTVTLIGYQNCSNQRGSFKAIDTSSYEYEGIYPPDPLLNFSIKLKDAKVLVDTNELQAYGGCNVADNDSSEIEWTLTKTSCESCPLTETQTQYEGCSNGRFSIRKELAEDMGETLLNDAYTLQVILIGSSNNRVLNKDSETILATTGNGISTPEITKDLPASDSVTESQFYFIEVEASGPGILTYQWYKDNIEIQGETNSALIFNKIQESDEGRYKVKIRLIGGLSVFSTELTLAVDPSDDPPPQKDVPTITQDLMQYDSVVEGQNYVMEVQATGSGTLTYQWYHNFRQIPGATSSRLVYPSIEKGHKGFYKVRVSLAGGSFVDSTSLWLRIKPEITQDLTASDTVTEGQRYVMEVQATGPENLALAYQWYKDNREIQGETNSALIFNKIQESNEGRYKVRIGLTGDTALTSVFSTELTLTVDPSDDPPPQKDVPTITQDLMQYDSVVEGQNYVMEVQATGSGTLTYQWYHNFRQIPGATSSRLVYPSIEKGHKGFYKVRVSLAGGSFVDSTSLWLRIKPEITQDLTASDTVTEGQRYVMEVQATGPENLALAYQWYKDNREIQGETNSALIFNKIQESNEGRYKVRIGLTGDTALTSVFSTELTLTVDPSDDPPPQKDVPTITQDLMQYDSVVEGQNYVMEVQATGSGTPHLSMVS